MRNKLVLIFIALFFVGCVKSYTGEKELTQTISPPLLILDYLDTDYTYDRPEIHLSLKNISNERLWFPIDLNTKIYYFDEKNNNWELVYDLITHSSMHDEMILEPKTDLMHSDIFLIISPDIPYDLLKKSENIRLRVEVFGNRMEGEAKTAIPVTARTEFVIKKP
jgi:hypothetical protein